MTTATSKPLPPPPQRRPATSNGSPPPSSQSVGGTLKVTHGATRTARRVTLFGPGGVGKTSLAASLALVGIKPLFIDLQNGSDHLDVARIDGVRSWSQLREAVNTESLWGGYGAVVIDTMTEGEELAVAHTISTVKNDKGDTVNSIEGYGYGKGYQYVYDTFLPILSDLDGHIRAGRSVILICHECTANVPNPFGQDFLRYEPRLQSPSSGKASIRHRVKEWADDLLFIGYDVFASKDGKGKGSGTRTIYPAEMPTHWAKSRKLSTAIPFDEGSSELWKQLFEKGNA